MVFAPAPAPSNPEQLFKMTPPNLCGWSLLISPAGQIKSARFIILCGAIYNRKWRSLSKIVIKTIRNIISKFCINSLETVLLSQVF